MPSGRRNLGKAVQAASTWSRARALAPLKIAVRSGVSVDRKRGAIGLFPKGQDVEAELTEAAKYWTIEADKVPSKTSPEGCIVVVRGLERRRKAECRP